MHELLAQFSTLSTLQLAGLAVISLMVISFAWLIVLMGTRWVTMFLLLIAAFPFWLLKWKKSYAFFMLKFWRLKRNWP